MTTLLTTTFYLWLVITILLVIMWFLRRQDILRIDEPEDDLLLPANDPGPQSKGASQAESGPKTTKIDAADGPEQTDDEQAGGDADSPDDSESEIDRLLSGLALPFDLAAINNGRGPDETYRIFLSSHPNAEEVGTAFADELAGLGYRIEAGDFDTATACRDDQVISMRIAADAGQPDNGEAGRYPGAQPGDVAIEVWTGDGPPPALNGKSGDKKAKGGPKGTPSKAKGRTANNKTAGKAAKENAE